MQIIPNAVGQADGVLVFWDESPEFGVAFPRQNQIIHEVRFGAGTLNHEDCLILYMFMGDQSVELYLPQMMETAPETTLDVWQLICKWKPDLLKVRYGSSPIDREKEVTLLLPKRDAEGLIDKLKEFVRLSKPDQGADELVQLHGTMVAALTHMLEDAEAEENGEQFEQ